MRIPSGKTDQKINFVAIDSNDRVTRKTGLTTFTVYRSRNGGAPVAMTTPTVAELSAANMPGVYALTLNEDTTVASTSDSEEMVLHITQANMASVTRVIELYRRDTTSGKTLTVDGNSRADASVGAMAAAVLTATAIASDAITDAKVASDVTIASVTGSVGSVTGAVGSVTGLTAANLDVAVSTRLAASSYTAPDNATITAINAKTTNLPSDPADESLIIAATDALGTAIAALPTTTTVNAIKAKTDSLGFTIAGQVDANVQYVNDVQVTGDGETGTEWGPA